MTLNGFIRSQLSSIRSTSRAYVASVIVELRQLIDLVYQLRSSENGSQFGVQPSSSFSMSVSSD